MPRQHAAQPTAIASCGAGHRIARASPITSSSTASRGLHFIYLNSDIERQFEFVQLTWINNPAFGGLYNEVDPVIGNLDRTDGIMTVQCDPLRTRVHNLRRVITVRGGAYLFLPGMNALCSMAALTT